MQFSLFLTGLVLTSTGLILNLDAVNRWESYSLLVSSLSLILMGFILSLLPRLRGIGRQVKGIGDTSSILLLPCFNL